MPKAVSMGKGKGGEASQATDETMITLAVDQCEDLQRSLAAIVTHEGMDKEDPNLEGAQREKYEKTVRTTAEKVSSEFGQSCDQNLVGKEVPRAMLKCMFQARTLAVFDQCTK
jgi:hypothetical protein